MTPEGRVKAKVKKALEQLGESCWRFMPVQSGYGAPALDFLCAIRGKFVAIETKAPGKALTPLQEITKANIEAAGGIVLVVWDETSLAIAMKIIFALEFQPDVKILPSAVLDLCRGGYEGNFRAERIPPFQGPPNDRFNTVPVTAAAGRDHGAPGKPPQGQPKPRSRG